MIAESLLIKEEKLSKNIRLFCVGKGLYSIVVSHCLACR